MAHSKHSELVHMNNVLTKHSQLVHMTNVLIVQYRYATLSSDGAARKKIAQAEEVLRRYKKYYLTAERY